MWTSNQSPLQNDWEVDRLLGKPNKQLCRTIGKLRGYLGFQQAPWQNNWEVEWLFGLPNKHLGRTIGKLSGYLGFQTSTLAEQLGS